MATLALSPLSAAEEAWIQSQIDAASSFAEVYSEKFNGDLTLPVLDEAFAVWLATNETDADIINGAINCVGIAFGALVVGGAGLRWAIATDQHGTELVVAGSPETGELLIYPANLVAKRWESKSTHFLEPMYQQIIDQINVNITAHANDKPRPWWKLWSMDRLV